MLEFASAASPSSTATTTPPQYAANAKEGKLEEL